MKSLAEFLGVDDPRLPEKHIEDVFDETLSVQDFCRGVLRSREYRQSVQRRILLDELPPAIEVLFYHYAEGKPTENVAVSGEVAVTKVVREVVRAVDDEDRFPTVVH